MTEQEGKKNVNRDDHGHFSKQKCDHGNKAADELQSALGVAKLTEVKVAHKNGLNVRAAPTKQSKVVKVLEFGTKLKIIDSIDGWHKIADGFVRAEFVK